MGLYLVKLKETQRKYFTNFLSISPRSTTKAVRAPVGSSDSVFNSKTAYLRKVGEAARSVFISNNERCNVEAIILAGSADLKDQFEDHIFDVRISSKIIASLDIAYGGENGFKQAIQLSSKLLENNRLIQEAKVVSRYFELISKGSNLVQFGVKDTMECLAQSNVDTLIVWEKLNTMIFTLENKKNHKTKVVYKPKEFSNRRLKNWEIVSSVPVIDWFFGLDLIENEDEIKTQQQIENIVANRLNGAKLEVISDNSSEGYQFCHSFGGIGCVLRYSTKSDDYDESDGDETDSSDYSEDENEDGLQEESEKEFEQNEELSSEIALLKESLDFNDNNNIITIVETTPSASIEVENRQVEQTVPTTPIVKKKIIFDHNAPVFIPSFMLKEN